MKKIINYIKNLYKKRKNEFEYFVFPIFLALFLLFIYFVNILNKF